MDMNAAFPSKYVKAADLQGKDVTAIVNLVQKEKMQNGDELPVVYFKGKEKGLVLNKTNANTIIGIMGGANTDAWTGKPITLFPTQTDFQGKIVDCIRIRPGGPVPQPASGPLEVVDGVPVEEYDPDHPDDIPF